MRSFLITITCFFAVGLATAASAEIVINEFLASNHHGYVDEDGDREDWIELHNPGTSSVNMTGFGLSDDPADPFKWVFPVRWLHPGQYRIIVASGKDRTGAELHCNFGIRVAGETLYLFDAEGSLLDQQTTGPLAPDVSRGRQPDGEASWHFFSEPTPGQPNLADPHPGIAERPIFLTDGGIHPAPVAVALAGIPGDELRYTLDGSVPLALSAIYTGPFQVDSSTVVRARSFRGGFIASPIATRSFLIGETVNLPILSLTIDPPDLWDPFSGIYVMGDSAETDWPFYGANFWENWEKPGYAEFFEQDGLEAFSQDIGLKIHGGYSRGYPQKSLRLLARDKYFVDEIEYPLFPDRPQYRYKRLVVRNTGQDFPYAHCRDVVAHELVKSADVERMATRASMVFVNGVYWGYMNVRERLDKFYLEDYFGVDPEAIDLIESGWSVLEGNASHWAILLDTIDTMDMSDPDDYLYLQSLMDTENFAEWNVLNIFMAHTDWPHHNLKRWRPALPGGRWRWLFFDMDLSLGAGLGNAEHNTLDMATNPDEEAWGVPDWATFVLRRLLENEQFEVSFLNFYADHLNSSFRSQRMHAVLDSVVDVIADEIPRHKSRWDIPGDWQGRLGFIRNFFDDRPAWARQHLMEKFEISDTFALNLDVQPPGAGLIKLARLEIGESWSGDYFAGVPVTLSAVPAPGYTFDHWSDTGLPQEPGVMLTAFADTSLTLFFRESAHSGAWAIINEINYHPADDFDPGDWVELHNPGDQDLDIGLWQFKDSQPDHSFLFPHGTVLPAGGYLVLCESSEDFSILFPDVGNIIGGMSFGLSAGGETLRLYDDDFELADTVTYDDDAPWPPEPDGDGPTLELINPFEDNADAANWAASEMPFPHGTPGTLNSVYGVTATPATPPTPLSLLRPHPNPFNPDTRLRFYLPAATRAHLAAYDIQGRRVAVITDEALPAGWHERHWRAEGVASGVYLLKLQSEGDSRARKVLLIK